MKTLSALLLGASATLAILCAPIHAQDIDADIAFGDDSSSWANDAECDDPRFEGEGMAGNLNQDDILKDATDCKALFDAGKIQLSDKQYDPSLTIVNGTDLGDNSYRWANDGQCDDARFEGEGMATTPSIQAIEKDRNDCSYGFQTGALTLASNLPDPVETEFDGIDFGHDKGDYANDGECDDPRFSGPGMGSVALSGANIGNDRLDCLTLYKAERVVFKANLIIDGYFFGDDDNLYAKDGECDDPRFQGHGMGPKPTISGIEHDASDCMAKWRAGDIEPVTHMDVNGFLIVDGVVFGNDSSNYANDGECDDPGFTGRGVADNSNTEHAGKDKSDCLAGFQSGNIKRAPVIPVERSITVDGIRFGDDDSQLSRDGECDDPRFTGSAMATNLHNEDIGHDAIDCLSAYQNGKIVPK